MIRLILESVYFIVPAYFANMAPVIAKKLRILRQLNKPIDMNNQIEGRPIFGKHKTFRGFIVAIVMGIFLSFVQKYLYAYPWFREISIVDYSHPVILGSLLSAGAMTGDLIKSFIKRRYNIRAGKPFIPFDQIDFVIGAYFFVLPFYYSVLSLDLFLSSIIISFFLHIMVNHLAFYLRIRKEKW